MNNSLAVVGRMDQKGWFCREDFSGGHLQLCLRVRHPGSPSIQTDSPISLKVIEKGPEWVACNKGLHLHISESESRSVVSDSLWPHGLYSPWNSPGQNTGVGSLSLLQGIFPTQGWNLGLLHRRQILYQLSHKGSPRILEWVAYPFSRDLPEPGIKPGSPALQDSLPTELCTYRLLVIFLIGV